MGIEDFLDEPKMEEPAHAPAPEQPVEEPAPQPEPEAHPAPEPEIPAEPPKEEPKHVPLATFLDQRDEAKRWKREAEEARAQLAQRQAPANIPDPIDDPAGFAAYNTSQIEAAKVEIRFDTSDKIARQMHGNEVVEAASEWASERAKSDRSFALAYMQQPHPIDWIVQQHKRDQMMAQIGDDPDAWALRRYAELNPAPPVAPVAAPATPAPVPPPPRSLASIPGSGGGVAEVPVGPLAATDALFQR